MSETGKEYADFMKEQRLKKEPGRVKYATDKLQALGYEVYYREDQKCIEFIYRGSIVRFYPYTGWYTGKAIQDGRGINKLLKQLK